MGASEVQFAAVQELPLDLLPRLQTDGRRQGQPPLFHARHQPPPDRRRFRLGGPVQLRPGGCIAVEEGSRPNGLRQLSGAQRAVGLCKLARAAWRADDRAVRRTDQLVHRRLRRRRRLRALAHASPGRADSENRLKELCNSFGIKCLCVDHFCGTEAIHRLAIATFNLCVRLQQRLGAVGAVRTQHPESAALWPGGGVEPDPGQTHLEAGSVWRSGSSLVVGDPLQTHRAAQLLCSQTAPSMKPKTHTVYPCTTESFRSVSQQSAILP